MRRILLLLCAVALLLAPMTGALAQDSSVLNIEDPDCLAEGETEADVVVNIGADVAGITFNGSQDVILDIDDGADDNQVTIAGVTAGTFTIRAYADATEPPEGDPLAQADVTIAPCDDPPLTSPEPVTPEFGEVEVEDETCKADVPGSIELPETEGITYTVTNSAGADVTAEIAALPAGTYTITATADEGFTLPEGVEATTVVEVEGSGETCEDIDLPLTAGELLTEASCEDGEVVSASLTFPAVEGAEVVYVLTSADDPEGTEYDEGDTVDVAEGDYEVTIQPTDGGEPEVIEVEVEEDPECDDEVEVPVVRGDVDYDKAKCHGRWERDFSLTLGAVDGVTYFIDGEEYAPGTYDADDLGEGKHWLRVEAEDGYELQGRHIYKLWVEDCEDDGTPVANPGTDCPRGAEDCTPPLYETPVDGPDEDVECDCPDGYVGVDLDGDGLITADDICVRKGTPQAETPDEGTVCEKCEDDDDEVPVTTPGDKTPPKVIKTVDQPTKVTTDLVDKTPVTTAVERTPVTATTTTSAPKGGLAYTGLSAGGTAALGLGLLLGGGLLLRKRRRSA